MRERALGTDIGSSVRLSAALTGVTGLRPTFGRVPNRGTMPNSSGFDMVGPVARRAIDVAPLFVAIAAYDDDDETPVDHPGTDVLAEIERGASGIRVGVPRSFHFDDADTEVTSAVHTSLEDLEQAGVGLPLRRSPTLRRGEVTHALGTLCLGWAFAGVPALTVPCDFTTGGPPVGMQFAALCWREDTVLRRTTADQQALRWHPVEPAVAIGR